MKHCVPMKIGIVCISHDWYIHTDRPCWSEHVGPEELLFGLYLFHQEDLFSAQFGCRKPSAETEICWEYVGN